MTLVTSDLTVEEARSITADIRAFGEGLLDRVVTAFRGRVWLSLGYESWDAWKQGELSDIELPREAIPALKSEGLSSRAIATVTGTDHSTVVRTGASAPVETVTGLDGKTRPAHVPNSVNKVTHVHYCRAPGCDKSFPYPVKHCVNCDRHYGGASHNCELAEAKEREADRLAALQRDKTRLELLVDGWISLTSLPAHPDRDELLALLNDHDRKTVLVIEAMYLEAK